MTSLKPFQKMAASKSNEALKASHYETVSQRQQFVSHQMETHTSGLWLIEEVSGNRLLHILTQLLPSIALSENVVRQALSHESTISFLCDTKDDFHAFNLSPL